MGGANFRTGRGLYQLVERGRSDQGASADLDGGQLATPDQLIDRSSPDAAHGRGVRDRVGEALDFLAGVRIEHGVCLHV